MAIDASSLLNAARAAAGAQQLPPGALYIVATPIGNLADLTLRAIHVLASVDAVACEDTRVSGGLLRHLMLDKPLIPVHQHNERTGAQAVIERLSRGERVAYVSDAGTPAVSDPGAVLVAAAAAAGYRVVPVPGASSALAALSVSGDVGNGGFRFVGFLPTRHAERRDALARIAADDAAQVLFEAPHRIAALAGELAGTVPERRLTICRELTKQFESIATLTAAALPAWLEADANRVRGEFVIVLHGPASLPSTPDAVDANATRLLQALMAELPLKQAVALAARACGAPRNALYQQALKLRGASGGNGGSGETDGGDGG